MNYPNPAGFDDDVAKLTRIANGWTAQDVCNYLQNCPYRVWRDLRSTYWRVHAIHSTSPTHMRGMDALLVERFGGALKEVGDRIQPPEHRTGLQSKRLRMALALR